MTGKDALVASRVRRGFERIGVAAVAPLLLVGGFATFGILVTALDPDTDVPTKLLPVAVACFFGSLLIYIIVGIFFGWVAAGFAPDEAEYQRLDGLDDAR